MTQHTASAAGVVSSSHDGRRSRPKGSVSERAVTMSIPDWAVTARAKWNYRGSERPPFATPPAHGQESVWDYPRPPRIEPYTREIIVCAAEIELARTRRALRVLETAGAPTIYIPRADVDVSRLVPTRQRSFCEWKGEAHYWSAALPHGQIEGAIWSYPDPWPGFEPIRDYLAFHPARFTCFIDGVEAQPQPGQIYGGWVTPDIVGPIKGAPGTEDW